MYSLSYSFVQKYRMHGESNERDEKSGLYTNTYDKKCALCCTDLYMSGIVGWVMMSAAVFLVILSVMFENSGIMKNGPRQAIFEAENQKVTFDDVHGVDVERSTRATRIR